MKITEVTSFLLPWGSAQKVERVRVCWSSGMEESFPVSKVNQRVRLVEGAGRRVVADSRQ